MEGGKGLLQKGVEDFGGEPWGVAGEEDEVGLWDEDLFAKRKEEGKISLDFEDLPLGASAKGGGIKEEGVVGFSPFDLSFEKFDRIVDDPSDGGFI